MSNQIKGIVLKIHNERLTKTYLIDSAIPISYFKRILKLYKKIIY